MRSVLISLLLGFVPLVTHGQLPEHPLQANDDGVAILGYSPVSYFSVGKPELGDPAFAVEFGGVTYWLTNREQLEMFKQDPERYIPAHGGWCTLMMGRFREAHPWAPGKLRHHRRPLNVVLVWKHRGDQGDGA